MSSPDLSELMLAARNVVDVSLAVAKNERLLIVRDTRAPATIGEAVMAYANSKEISTGLLVFSSPIPPKNQLNINGMYYSRVIQRAAPAEPPQFVKEALKNADAIFAYSNTPLRNAAQDALKAGARMAAMGSSVTGNLTDAFVRTMAIDHESLVSGSEKVATAMSGDREIRVTSPAGTDITFKHTKDRPVIWDHYAGVARKPGSLGQLPPGIIATSPKEGTANGRIVVDAALFGLDSPIRDPFTINVENHRIVSVKGGGEIGAMFWHALEVSDAQAKNCPAEWGPGMNPGSLMGPNVEGETPYGTAHIAAGRNTHVANGAVSSNFHSDFMIREPTIYVDGKMIIEGTKHLV